MLSYYAVNVLIVEVVFDSTCSFFGGPEHAWQSDRWGNFTSTDFYHILLICTIIVCESPSLIFSTARTASMCGVGGGYHVARHVLGPHRVHLGFARELLK